MEGLARQTIYGATPNFSAFPIIVQLCLFSDCGSAGSAEHPSCKQPAVSSLPREPEPLICPSPRFRLIGRYPSGYPGGAGEVVHLRIA